VSSGLSAAVARQGRWLLIGGLLAGIAVPGAAGAVAPLVGPLVVALLFLAVLRLGPEDLARGRRALGPSVVTALALQLALPLAMIGGLALTGTLGSAWGQGLVLMLAAAPITGAPHIARMAGGDPAVALRQVAMGTALLPLTALPVFALMPAFGSPAEVSLAVAKLLAVIAVAGGCAVALRATGTVRGTPRTLERIDATAAILLAVVVVGLMSAVGAAIREDSARFAATMALVLVATFGLQAVAAFLWRNSGDRASMAVVTANRNVALFLGVLPPALVSDLLLFIGCYQIPMYLTPLILPAIIERRMR
jgi:arsenite transporter